jgi:hypothetical protein
VFSPAAIPSTTLLPTLSPTGSPNRPKDPEGTGNNSDRNVFLTREVIISICAVVVVFFFTGILLVALAYFFIRKRATRVLKCNPSGSNSATQVTTVSIQLDTKPAEPDIEPTPSTFLPVCENRSNDEEKAQMTGEVGKNETTTNESGTQPTAPAQTPQQVKETEKRMSKLTSDLPKLPPKKPTVNIKENENRVSWHLHGKENCGGEKEEGGKVPAASLGARKLKRNGGGERVSGTPGATKPPKPNGREARATQKNTQSDKPSAQNNSNKASPTTSPPSGNRRRSSFSPGRQAPPPPPPNNGKRTPAVRSSSSNAAATASGVRTPSSTSPSTTRSPTSHSHGARPKKT